MSDRVPELEAEIRRLTRQRDAQPTDTLYALHHQARIDVLSIELIAWHLEPARMLAAETAIRDAGRRARRAQTGRRRWPAVAGVSGAIGGIITAGSLATHNGPSLIGSTLLAVAVAALALTVVDRARDARDADQADVDIEAAQRTYAAIVARHTRHIAPLRPLAIHSRPEEASCSPQSSTPAITPRTPSSLAITPSTATSPAASAGPTAATALPAAASPRSAGPWTAAA